VNEFTNERLGCMDCGSSDGLAPTITGSGYCHACPKDEAFKPRHRMEEAGNGKPHGQPIDHEAVRAPVGPSKGFTAFPDRGISASTAKAYKVSEGPRGVRVFYYGENATKTKTPDKAMATTGDFKNAELFGQHLFAKGGRSITVTEGEEDAMACYQMHGSKYPAVSIKSGAQSAITSCKEQYDYLNSFETIYISFDADKPGISASLEVAALFSDKAKIMKHGEGHKDACDYLKAGDGHLYVNAWWRAEAYMPDSIVKSSDLYDDVMSPLQMPFASYPWDCLNLKVYGMRTGEIVTVMAGSGVGKSTFVKELLRQVYESTEHKIGVLSLEESVAVAAQGMMSISAQKVFHLPTVSQMKDILLDPTRVGEKPSLEDITQERRQQDKEKAFEDMLSTDRFMFLKHEGRITVESVIGQMKYLSKAQDCKVLLLDHISILVGLVSSGKTNEREAIDSVMHELRKLVEETDIMLINICHLRKPVAGATSHDEGGRVHANEARGSGAIMQLSNIGIALEADRQHEDEKVRNSTIVRVLKNRFSGEVGVAGLLQYSLDTGRLTEIKNIDLEQAL
jgi:twinkle protein